MPRHVSGVWRIPHCVADIRTGEYPAGRHTREKVAAEAAIHTGVKHLLPAKEMAR
jgi:hypothetical protein